MGVLGRGVVVVGQSSSTMRGGGEREKRRGERGERRMRREERERERGERG